jgi:release factor H-coupled RctB family protein
MTRATIRIIASSESWIDQTAVDQLHRSAALEGMDEIVGLPDLHAGRGIAVGAAFWSRSHVFPHLVGSDIGCGMALWQSATPVRKFRLDAADRKLRGLDEPWSGDHAARLVEAGLPPDLMGEKLGCIGGGNHFAELLCVEAVQDRERFDALGLEEANVLLMVHSGSRGLGQAILERHLSDRCERGLKTGTAACASYLEAHDEAVVWAILNREIIAVRFLGRLGMKAKRLIDICHNNVVRHRGGWLHRKGSRSGIAWRAELRR